MLLLLFANSCIHILIRNIAEGLKLKEQCFLYSPVKVALGWCKDWQVVGLDGFLKTDQSSRLQAGLDGAGEHRGQYGLFESPRR